MKVMTRKCFSVHVCVYCREDDWPPDLVNSHPDEDLYEAYGLVFEGDALNPSYLPPEMKAAAIAAKGVMVEDKWDEDQTPAVEEEDPFEKVLL